jgi:hypothetical protein
LPGGQRGHYVQAHYDVRVSVLQIFENDVPLDIVFQNIFVGGAENGVASTVCDLDQIHRPLADDSNLGQEAHALDTVNPLIAIGGATQHILRAILISLGAKRYLFSGDVQANHPEVFESLVLTKILDHSPVFGFPAFDQ